MFGLAQAVSGMEADLVRLRRDFHQHPELAFSEHRTGRIVTESMRSMGATVRTGVGGTGVVATLQGARPGPTLLIRAEMDGLPITEATGLAHASVRPGVMHACGHDAHLSAVIGVARLLSDRIDEIGGRVRFCFQPAEESLSGAERMIADGALDGVDVVLGAHVHSAAPYGTVLATPGPVLAGADFFSIVVHGRAGHAGAPHMTVDPVYVGSQIVVALPSIVSRETSPGQPLVIHISGFEGDSVANVVRETVTLTGNVRWLDESVRQAALARISALAGTIASAYGARAVFRLVSGAPVSSNDPALLQIAADAAKATGRAAIVKGSPITASDDWAYYARRLPGALLLFGSGGPGAPPHHHPRFDLDERVIGLMAEVLVASVLRLLDGRDARDIRPDVNDVGPDERDLPS